MNAKSPRWYVLISVLLLAVILSIPVIMLYTMPKQNALSILVGRTLHLPFARLYGFTIDINQYLTDIATIEYFEDDTKIFSKADLQRKVWMHLHEEYALRKLAAEKNITWTDTDLELSLNSFLRDNELSSSDLYASIPHFDMEYFKRHTILPIVLRTKISKSILLAGDNESAREINALHAALVESPSSFLARAQQRAESQHIAYKDELILISSKEISAEEAALLRSLNVDAISPVIVREDGYRVYQVVAYFTEPEEAWQVREIFVPYSPLEEELNQIQEEVDAKVYIRGLLPEL